MVNADSAKSFLASKDHAIRPYELFLFAAQEGFATDLLTFEPINGFDFRSLQTDVTEGPSILDIHGGADQAFRNWLWREGNEAQ